MKLRTASGLHVDGRRRARAIRGPRRGRNQAASSRLLRYAGTSVLCALAAALIVLADMQADTVFLGPGNAAARAAQRAPFSVAPFLPLPEDSTHRR